MLPLTDSQQQTLLRLAREALEGSVLSQRLAEIAPPTAAPLEPCGAFVSLHKGKRLRGCIGHIEALKPIYQTVRECAFSAAFYDPRFDPVTADELSDLSIEISVLSPFFEISPEQLEVGRDAVAVRTPVMFGEL